MTFGIYIETNAGVHRVQVLKAYTQVGYMVPALAYATSATTLASMADYLRRPGYVN